MTIHQFEEHSDSHFQKFDDNGHNEKLKLLFELKQTVERIVSYPAISVWFVHGGIKVLIDCLEKIFIHRNKSRESASIAKPNYWHFISCLRWLKPILAVDIDLILKASHKWDNHGQAFIFKCLENGNISDCISELLRDPSLVTKHYDKSAYLNDKMFTTAMILCLKAVEERSSGLLARISLNVINGESTLSKNSSPPSRVHLTRIEMSRPLQPLTSTESICIPFSGDPLEHVSTTSKQKLPRKSSGIIRKEELYRRKYKTSRSETFASKQQGHLPDIVTCAENSEIFRNADSSISEYDFSQASITHTRTLFDNEQPSSSDSESRPLEIHDVRLSHTPKPFHDIEQNLESGSEKHHRRCVSDLSLADIKKLQNTGEGDYFQDTFLNQQSNTTAMFNYLKNQDLSTCADLKKENAHFHFSEMLITMMEEKKCVSSKPDLITASSNSTISDSTLGNDEMRRLPIYFSNGSLDNIPSISDPSSVPTTSGFASSFSERDCNASTSSVLSDFDLCNEFDDLTDKVSSDPKISESLESPFMLSSESRSAETIAIELLRSFTRDTVGSQESSEIEWLVSEEDVPQQLLPMPTSTSIDPEAAASQSLDSAVFSGWSSDSSFRSRIRGNEEWAPPRFQIVFSVHRSPKRSQAIANQKYMCAGCGARVEKAYIKRFRYCEYLGKYFCSCCHDNTTNVIPAHIFSSFNFKKYRVSNFSRELLRKIQNEPLFNIDDINHSLYTKSKSLANTLNLRIQIGHLMKYVRTCRYLQISEDSDSCSLRSESSKEPKTSDESLLETLKENRVPVHILHGDPNTYSIQDLMMVKLGEMETLLKEFVKLASAHVTSCEFCCAKGFICELCGDMKDVIFPYQLSTCFQCHSCNACYHKKCYNTGKKCPKCERISQRKKLHETEPSTAVE